MPPAGLAGRVPLVYNISAVIIRVMVFQGLKHNDVFHIVSFLFQFITTHMLQAEKPKEWLRNNFVSVLIKKNRLLCFWYKIKNKRCLIY